MQWCLFYFLLVQVTIYQASEKLYDLFDKVCVIHSGRMIYFGPTALARQYFIDMGFEPANRQTTADFLVSVTDRLGRNPRSGWEDRVPRSPEEFSRYYVESDVGRHNLRAVESYLAETGSSGESEKIKTVYKESARAERAKHMKPSSAYTVSVWMQVKVIMRRRVQIIEETWLLKPFRFFLSLPRL